MKSIDNKNKYWNVYDIINITYNNDDYNLW